MVIGGLVFVFFFKQKTAYEIYQCDWSSDVCSSDLHKAASEVVKLGENPKLSGYIYPLMQVLDEPDEVVEAIFTHYENRGIEPSVEGQPTLLDL